MNKLKAVVDAGGGTMQLSDMLTEWELGIGALQSKIIRRVISHVKENKGKNDDTKEKEQNDEANNQNDQNKNNENAKNNDDNKDPEKEANANSDDKQATANGSADDK